MYLLIVIVLIGMRFEACSELPEVNQWWQSQKQPERKRKRTSHSDPPLTATESPGTAASWA